jgi:outer membrane protein
VGASWAAYLPLANAEVSGGPSKVVSSSPGRIPTNRLTYGVNASLSWLLLDAGGRGGTIEAARQSLFAADFAYNATLQDVALQTETADFVYQAARELLAAQRVSVETARTNLAAAQQRHDVGLATIADVLQAQTALGQAELAMQNAEGGLQAARAGLAVALGVTANSVFDIAQDTAAAPVAEVAESVDSLIERAARERPDIAQARAEVREAEAQARVARSAIWPAVSLTASAGRTFSDTSVLRGSTYGLTFGLAIPLTSGYARQYEAVAAREEAAALAARYQDVRLHAAAQVFTAYYALRSATQRVTTANLLRASAEQSESVARGRYQEGVGTILDLLTAQSALADARSQQVQARWDWYGALAQLAHDVGVLGPHGEAPLRLTSDSARSQR